MQPSRVNGLLLISSRSVSMSLSLSLTLTLNHHMAASVKPWIQAIIQHHDAVHGADLAIVHTDKALLCQLNKVSSQVTASRLMYSLLPTLHPSPPLYLTQRTA